MLADFGVFLHEKASDVFVCWRLCSGATIIRDIMELS